MQDALEMISASEAAALAAVEVRDVHRAFDEKLLPDTLLLGAGGGRRVARKAVPLLAFYFQTASILQAEARRAVIRRMGSGIPAEAVAVGGGVSADLRPFVAEAESRARLLDRARAMAVRDPNVLGGTEPVVSGTRVPVHDVAASVRAGMSMAEILESYPSLSADQVEMAALYARAEPPRGKPRRPLSDRLPQGARIVSSGVVTRPRVRED